MSVVTVVPAARPLHGTLTVPSDKSIAHRALLLGAVARGETVVRGFAGGEDNQATRDACVALGVAIETRADELRIRGGGWDGWRAPAATLDCRNSGTTMRLLAGMLAGRPFTSRLDGDESLRRRPMGRVIEPLARMGAVIGSEGGSGRAPLVIEGRPLVGARHDLAIASAQLKSAILLAGLQARGTTTVTEPATSRDHTERMLARFGVTLDRHERTTSVAGPQELAATEVTLPGDLSSAAFFIVAALLVPGSSLMLGNVGVNPTRTGILDVLVAMGARITITDAVEHDSEPRATIVVESGPLHATRIAGDTMLRAIDEFPILCIAAAAAQGTTEIRDAAELRVKESDRVAVMAETLRALGVEVEELPDGLVIDGPVPMQSARVDARGDHRIAMAAAVAGLVASGPVTIAGAEAAEVSFPRFYETLASLVS